MLISRRPDHLQLITHPDHGVIAGALGAHWGNAQFAVPHVREALLTAATHHDDGWHELDGQPIFNPGARRPAHFLELDLSTTVGPYGRGVDSVYERDELAGALVSMHWSGLYSTRWGLQGGGPVGHPLAAGVVSEQERRWVTALRTAWNFSGPRSAFEADVWHAYDVLQALDFISLALCLLDLDDPASDEEPLPMPGTLPSIEQPTSRRIVPSVPRCAGASHVDLAMWVSEPCVVRLHPFPFDEGFVLSLPARALEDRPYASATEAARAFHDAPLQQLQVTVAAGG